MTICNVSKCALNSFYDFIVKTVVTTLRQMFVSEYIDDSVLSDLSNEFFADI